MLQRHVRRGQRRMCVLCCAQRLATLTTASCLVVLLLALLKALLVAPVMSCPIKYCYNLVWITSY